MDLSHIEEQARALRETLKPLLEPSGGLRDSLGLDSEQVTALAVYARELAQQGQVEPALRLLEGLQVLEPHNGYLSVCLGALLSGLGRREEAIRQLELALACQPDDVAANVLMGEIRLHEGEKAAARAHLEIALREDPQGAQPHGKRARALAVLAVGDDAVSGDRETGVIETTVDEEGVSP